MLRSQRGAREGDGGFLEAELADDPFVLFNLGEFRGHHI